MKLLLVWILLLLFAGCRNHYVHVKDIPAKSVQILPGYTVLYCECMDNNLQQKLIQELTSHSIPVTKLARIEDFNQVALGKYYALFGMKREISGNPRKYTVTSLEGRSESGNCGKDCTWRRSWNELVTDTAETNGFSSHENLMLYRVDEETELVLALSKGQRYQLKLEFLGNKGSDSSTVKEKSEYEITR